MSENETKKSPIRGAFVLCQKIYGKKISNEACMIKISSINLIEPYEWPDVEDLDTKFYTYKDSAYYAECHPYDITHAINEFLFDPQEHWKKYPT
jgi:hypothetical protein